MTFEASYRKINTLTCAKQIRKAVTSNLLQKVYLLECVQFSNLVTVSLAKVCCIKSLINRHQSTKRIPEISPKIKKLKTDLNDKLHFIKAIGSLYKINKVLLTSKKPCLVKLQVSIRFFVMSYYANSNSDHPYA